MSAILFWVRRQVGATVAWLVALAWPHAEAEPVAAGQGNEDEVSSPTVEDQGQWYFKRDILDRLDQYFDCAARLRSADPEGYQFVAKVGAMIVASNYRVLHGSLDQQRLPSMGAVAFAMGDTEPDDDTIYPVFEYFRRYDVPPAHVEKAAGTVYEVTLFYADKARPELVMPHKYHVAVKDGATRLLKERHVYYQSIPAKTTAAKRRGRAASVPRLGWRHPAFLNEFRGDKMSGEDRAKSIFEITANLYAQASAGLRVRVAKESLVAAFSIDLLRMPYFFKDRDVTLTEGGRRKKIFHIVRTHARRIGSTTRYVRSHFRGERKFGWNGYSIIVSMPGKHHADLLNLQVGGHDVDAEVMPRGMISTEALAKKLDRHLAA